MTFNSVAVPEQPSRRPVLTRKLLLTLLTYVVALSAGAFIMSGYLTTAPTVQQATDQVQQLNVPVGSGITSWLLCVGCEDSLTELTDWHGGFCCGGFSAGGLLPTWGSPFSWGGCSWGSCGSWGIPAWGGCGWGGCGSWGLPTWSGFNICGWGGWGSCGVPTWGFNTCTWGCGLPTWGSWNACCSRWGW